MVVGGVAGVGLGVIGNVHEVRGAKALLGWQLGARDKKATLEVALADVAVTAREFVTLVGGK